MVATPAAFASDFVTGVIMGQLLSDDSGSKKVNNSDPESKTVIEYHDGQPIVTKMEVLKNNKWRKLDGPQGGYFVCPGEYRSYSGRQRCRVYEDGFSGFMGAMTDAQELTLQEALTKMEGKPITLQTIEIHGNNLAVKYLLAPPAQTHVKTQNLGVVKQDIDVPKVAPQPSTPASLSVSKTDPSKQNVDRGFERPIDSIIGLIANACEVIAVLGLVVGIAGGVMRRSVWAVVMGIIPSLALMNMPTVLGFMFDTGEASAKSLEDSKISFPFVLVALLPVLIFFVCRAFVNYRRYPEIGDVLREFQRTERAERESNEPPSVGELHERQQQNIGREPVVVSSSAPAPKVQKEEPIEVRPGKRKVILD
ncbi:TPA: hypothetical protein ACHH7Y_002665 [Escherichia coli]